MDQIDLLQNYLYLIELLDMIVLSINYLYFI